MFACLSLRKTARIANGVGANLMKKKLYEVKDLVMAIGPVGLLLAVILVVGYKFIDPAPPHHFVISTGDGSGNYYSYAKQYQEIIKEDKIDLEIRTSKGAWDNLTRLIDPGSDVDVGFVQDGLGDRKKFPKLSSIGSLYYEPVWIFYRGKKEITRFSQFTGMKIGMGEKGGEAHTMAKKLLGASGIDDKNTQLLDMTTEQEAADLQSGKIDAAFFIATGENPLLNTLFKNSDLRLMSVDQADAITRQFPYLHHLILPHGTINLGKNIPSHDVDLVAATATIVVRNSLHPALVYLLLKATSKVHHLPGMFESKNEFPIDKDFVFPLNAGAKNFYKSGAAPFWMRYLPFWLATIAERFIFLIIPILALVLPAIKMVPRFLDHRVKSRIYQRYGELKLLENRMKMEPTSHKYDEFLAELDGIEDRVNRLKFPLDVVGDVYVLREHIHFVRQRLDQLARLPDSRSSGATGATRSS